MLMGSWVTRSLLQSAFFFHLLFAFCCTIVIVLCPVFCGGQTKKAVYGHLRIQMTIKLNSFCAAKPSCQAKCNVTTFLTYVFQLICLKVIIDFGVY